MLKCIQPHPFHSYLAGKCYNILVDNSTAKLVLVPPQHSVCFQCLFHIETREESDISWKIGGRVLQPGRGNFNPSKSIK